MSNFKVLIESHDQTLSVDTNTLRKTIRSEINNGNRLVSFFALPSIAHPDDAATLHFVYIKSGQLHHLRTSLSNTHPYRQLTSEMAQMHCFEREVHEQFGLPMPGHPWLKPIRFEGKSLGRMDDYPFYKLEGKEVHEVGVGPIHAGVIEPGHFRFMCFGETVEHLEIHLGYQHRGIEPLLLKTPTRLMSPLIESVAGDTAIGYTLCFCRAIEALGGIHVEPAIESVRTIALELERIAMHLAGLSGLATDIAFLPGSSTYGRLRTAVINLSMRLCGSRFGRGWFRPGELRYSCDSSHRADVRQTLHQVKTDIAIINRLFLNSTSVQHRLKTTGVVTNEMAIDIGLVGMSARSSGVPRDLRSELRNGAYGKHPIMIVTEGDGDCWSRGLVRIREIDESIEWILVELESLEDVSAQPRCEYQLASNSHVISVEEGWRGEIVHYLETNERGQIIRYKVQDPSLRNWFGLAQAVKKNAIYDFPICNKSFDLSYCGNDL